MPAQNKNQGAKLAKAIQAAMERGIQEAVSQLDADLKAGSPVDEGRFRLGWTHVQAKGDPTTNAVPAENPSGEYPAPQDLDPTSVNPKLNQRIINNLPYASRLCRDGWSKKTSADWFLKIENQWLNGKYLDDAYRSQGLK